MRMKNYSMRVPGAWFTPEAVLHGPKTMATRASIASTPNSTTIARVKPTWNDKTKSQTLINVYRLSAIRD